MPSSHRTLLAPFLGLLPRIENTTDAKWLAPSTAYPDRAPVLPYRWAELMFCCSVGSNSCSVIPLETLVPPHRKAAYLFCPIVGQNLSYCTVGQNSSSAESSGVMLIPVGPHSSSAFSLSRTPDLSYCWAEHLTCPKAGQNPCSALSLGRTLVRHVFGQNPCSAMSLCSTLVLPCRCAKL